MTQEKLFQPYLGSLGKDFGPGKFGRDVAAGFSVALVSFPLALALGQASGLTPAQGLLSAVVGSFFLALLGGSRVQIGGPTAVLTVLTLGIVYRFGPTGLVLATLLAGAMLVAMGFFRLGALVRFIPQPIVLGLTAGIAVTLLLGQAKDLFGLNLEKLPADLVPRLGVLATGLGTFQPWACAVGVGTLALIAVFLKFLPRWPVAFLVLIAASVAVRLFSLPVATVGTVFGPISFSLPSLDLRSLSYQACVDLLPSAFTVALLVAIEGYQSATVTDAMVGGRYRPDTDLISQGIANLVLSVLGGVPASGTVERSVANVRFGARSPVAGLTHALVLLFCFVFLIPWTAYIPLPSLAGLTLLIGFRLGSWKDLPLVVRTTRSDALALVVTFLVTVFVNLVFAILSGLIVSSFFFIRSIAHSSSAHLSLPEDPESKVGLEDLPRGTSVLALSGAFFFGAATKFEQTFRDILPRTQTLVLRMGDLTLLDASGTRVLDRLLDEAKAHRVRVVVTEAQPDILRILEHAGLISAIGPGNLFASLDGVLKDLRSTQPLIFSIRPEGCTIDPI